MNKIHLHLATAIASLIAALTEMNATQSWPEIVAANLPPTDPEPEKKKGRGPAKEKTAAANQSPADPADPAKPVVEQPKAPASTSTKTVADNPEAWNEAKMLAKPLIENKKQLLVRDLVTKHGGDKIISSIPLENLDAFKAEVTSEIEKAGLKEEY